jgi:hypothetical protein
MSIERGGRKSLIVKPSMAASPLQRELRWAPCYHPTANAGGGTDDVATGAPDRIGEPQPREIGVSLENQALTIKGEQS